MQGVKRYYYNKIKRLNFGKEIISINSISDTFSINCYSKRVLIDKTKYTTDYFEYMDITNCLSDMAFQGDTNAISAIIKHVNHKNFMGYKRFAASPRGKRLFEHILYNIASEIYCGNPYADETMGNEGISPGMDELMEMVKHWPPEEDQLREIFTEKVKSERNEKYTHLMTIDERGFPKWEACRYVQYLLRITGLSKSPMKVACWNSKILGNGSF
ncbi:MAG: hypothetical protein IPO37_24630 [Saprospiraceae bacterium]|nr:hypothetical protein [Saprospiraceae bacterium]